MEDLGEDILGKLALARLSIRWIEKDIKSLSLIIDGIDQLAGKQEARTCTTK